jgi:ElaB/YqjD/DUF883 family membrane-anchored ribosome-binding protein
MTDSPNPPELTMPDQNIDDGANADREPAMPHPLQDAVRLMDSERMQMIQENAKDLDRRARAFIRENPAPVILGAVAVGFLIGRLVRS